MSPLLAMTLVVSGGLETFTTPDGLDVLVDQRSGARICSARLVVRAGAREDPPGKAGLAHVVEHLAFGGPAGIDYITRTPADIGANTTAGGTVFSLETSAENCASELGRFLGVVTDGKLARRWFRREMAVIGREALMREDARSLLDSAMFGNRIEAILGTATTRETITRDDVVRFFQTHYVTEKLALVVVGPLDTAAVRQALDFGIHAGPSLPGDWHERTEPRPSPSGESRLIDLEVGNVLLATALPPSEVEACHEAALLLELRLARKLRRTLTRASVDCLWQQGNLILAVMLRTAPDEEESLVQSVLPLWRSLAAPTAEEKRLVNERVGALSELVTSDPSAWATTLAHAALWLRGEALFSVAPRWWTPPSFDAARLARVREATGPRRSILVRGSLRLEKEAAR